MNLVKGQRWLYDCSCHRIVVEVPKSCADSTIECKIVQIKEQDKFCTLRLLIGDIFLLSQRDGYWKYLEGQDAPQ